MKTVKLAFLGFGTVGRAFAEMLEVKRGTLRNDFGLNTKIVAISTLSQGSAFKSTGLDTTELLASKRVEGGLASVTGGHHNSDLGRLLDKSGADILIELSYTNPKNGEPARSYCKRALTNGMKVITANKGPAAFGLSGLETDENFGIEGSVMAGTPVISFKQKCLLGAKITKFNGILNGTSNYILGEMEKGTPLETAIADAQELGYAEADPTADIEGFDAMMKVIILSKVIFGRIIRPNDVACSGISAITTDMVEKAAKENKKWKLIGSGEMIDGEYVAKVKAELVDEGSALYGVSGAANALCITSEEMGDMLVSGAGAGPKETAYALLSDLIFLSSP